MSLEQPATKGEAPVEYFADLIPEENLISPGYKAIQEKFHFNKKEYGVSGHKWADHVKGMAAAMKTEDVLDYGCGKCTLSNAIPHLQWQLYDPCIKRHSKMPVPSDLVVCTDVLEHIEPDKLDNVLDHLRSLTKKAAFLVIHLGPANKHFPDGTNAHLIQESYKWWTMKVWDRWNVDQMLHNEFWNEEKKAYSGTVVLVCTGGLSGSNT